MIDLPLGTSGLIHSAGFNAARDTAAALAVVFGSEIRSSSPAPLEPLASMQCCQKITLVDDTVPLVPQAEPRVADA